MAGQVYRYQDGEGKVTLTDQRRAGKPAVDPSMAALDELVNESRFDRSKYAPVADGGVDALLAQAKQSGPVAQELDRIQHGADAGVEEEKRLRAEQAQGIGDALDIGWQAPAGGLSLLSGPVGLAAGAPFAYNAVKDLVANPGVGTGVMAALAALPFAKQARTAWKGASELSAVKALRAKFPNVKGAEVPYKASNVNMPAKAASVDPPGWGSTPLGAAAKSQPSQAVAAMPKPAPVAFSAMDDAALTPTSVQEEAQRIQEQIARRLTGGQATVPLVPFSEVAPEALIPINRLKPKTGLSQFGPDAQAAQMDGKASRARAMIAHNADVPDSMAALGDDVDWRQVPPTQGTANFVKEHVGRSQQELAQMLGERDYGFKEVGARIKSIKKPIYPAGNSKTDKLVAAMRQREKLMGYND